MAPRYIFNPLEWPVCLELPGKMSAIAWQEHIPFAMTLMHLTKPQVLVELGVHKGDSYLAFCQAIASNPERGDSKCYGVDTWQGDPHAGYYGDDVLTELRRFHDAHYSSFSRLIQGTFDDAARGFAEGSIDLLHIDGTHTYDAVKCDWETWLPKLSPRAIVLFHDTNVHEMDFGVWKLWAELAAAYPHFEFKHGHGLGVLAVGPDIPAAAKFLFELNDSQAALLGRFFAQLGNYLTLFKASQSGGLTHGHSKESLLQQTIVELTAKIGEYHTACTNKEQMLLVQEKALADQDAKLSLYHTTSTNKDVELGEQMKKVSDLSSKIAEYDIACTNKDALLREQLQAISRMTSMIAEYDAACTNKDELLSQNAKTITNLDARIAEYRAASQIKDTEVEAHRKSAAEAIASSNDLQSRILAAQAQIGELAARMQRNSLKQEIIDGGRFKQGCELRVLFITEMADAPFRYRVSHAVEQLQQAGVHARWLKPSGCQAGVMSSYHVAVFYRVRHSDLIKELIDEAHRSSTVTVFDCDDMIFFAGAEKQMHFMNDQSESDRILYNEMTASMERTARACRYFIGSTPALVEKAAEMGLTAFLHRNVLSDFQERQSAWLARMRKHSPSIPLMGYFSGSNTHDSDFRSIQPALAEIFRKLPNARLLIVGHLQPDAFLQEFSNRIWKLPYMAWQEYPALMARCRVLLAPVARRSRFTHAKSALKFFEAGAIGVPVIATPIAEMQAAIIDNKNGWLAQNHSEWVERLALALDPKNSVETGERARQTVLGSCTVSSQKNALENLFQGMVGEQARKSRQPLNPSWVEPPNTESSSERLKRRFLLARYLFTSLDGMHPKLNKDVKNPAASGSKFFDLLEYWHAGPHDVTELAEMTLDIDPVMDVSVWDRLTLEIRISSAEKYPRLMMFFCKAGETRLADTPALMLPIEAGKDFQTLEINLRALPRMVQGLWRSSIRQIKISAVPAGTTFTIHTLTLHDSARRIQPDARTVFIRENLAARYLRGGGIEIGALQNPLTVPAEAKVKYVDVLTKAEALKHFPELPPSMLVDPEIISNGQTLTGVPDSNFDFCIANHVLEHMRNPAGALRNWLRVLRPGGIAYVAIPDRTNKLDHTRPVSRYEHVLLDDTKLDREHTDHVHYLEWAIHVNGRKPGADAEARAAELEALKYNIHFHVYDQALFKNILEDACREAPAQICELLIHNDQGAVEHICVLRKLPAASVLRRPVAIVVPIYNAYDEVVRTCSSVLAHARGECTLIPVDDASTDPRISEYLKNLAARDKRVKVLRNIQNSGFVITANNGMKAAPPDADILLLNSDVQVTEGFLRRIQDTALDNPECGVVTPFSNNATIFSIPLPNQDNSLPPGFDTDEFHKVVSLASRRQQLPMPTAVGFCMYIRREVIQKAGLFDEVSFGRGFGEENDFCERAKRLGFSIRICDDQFIFHAGKASFGAEGHALSAKNGLILDRKYPEYNKSVARFVTCNPLREARQAILVQTQRWKFRDEPALLILLHSDPFKRFVGGTEAHVLERIANMGLKRVVLVYPGSPSSIKVAEFLDGSVSKPLNYRFNLVSPLAPAAYSHPEAEDLILFISQAFGCAAFMCDHMLWFPLDVVEQLKKGGLPYLFVVHDFYAICPSLNLLNENMRPCDVHAGGVKKGDSRACLSDYFSKYYGTPAYDCKVLLSEHQARFEKILMQAERIIFPSDSARSIFMTNYKLQPSRTAVIPHGYAATPPPVRAESGTVLKVAIIGAFALPIKGCDLILETIAQTDASVEWHFFGDAEALDFRRRVDELNRSCVFHGPYLRETIVKSLIASGVDVSLFTSVCPETFSFTLTESWCAGVPALVPQMGALSERVESTGYGWTFKPNCASSASETIEKLVSNRDVVREKQSALRGFVHESLSENAKKYRALIEPLLQFRTGREPMALHHLSEPAGLAIAEEVLSRETFAAAPDPAISLIPHFEPLHQLMIVPRGAVVAMISSGRDPHCLAAVSESDMPLLRIDIESPVETMLQLFYSTSDSPSFVEERSIRKMLLKGRNLIFAEIRSAKVTSLRFDPGESPGEYILHAFDMKAAPSPSGTSSLYFEQVLAKEKFTKISGAAISLIPCFKPLHQFEAVVNGHGAVITSSGNDPHCIVSMDECDMPLIKLDIESPTEANLQIFYSSSEVSDFEESQSVLRNLSIGRNIFYIEIHAAKVKRLRFDPSDRPGEYILNAFELKTANLPPAGANLLAEIAEVKA